MGDSQSTMVTNFNANTSKKGCSNGTFKESSGLIKLQALQGSHGKATEQTTSRFQENQDCSGKPKYLQEQEAKKNENQLRVERII